MFYFFSSSLRSIELSGDKILIFSSLADTSTLDFRGLLSGFRKLCVCANKARRWLAFMSETDRGLTTLATGVLCGRVGLCGRAGCTPGITPPTGRCIGLGKETGGTTPGLNMLLRIIWGRRAPKIYKIICKHLYILSTYCFFPHTYR